MLRTLDLFSGIGGFSLGLERTGGFETVAFCEIDPFCRKVLAKHWPGVPIHEDVTKLRGEDVGPIDVICGGFPCQDISAAGAGAGIDGERSGLWREFARLIGEVRPRYAIVENVSALLGRGIDRVLGDLSEIGYDAEWHCIPASAVGAPHRRDRVWLVAYPKELLGDGSEHNAGCLGEIGRQVSESGNGSRTPDISNPSRIQQRRPQQRPERERVGQGGESAGELAGNRERITHGNGSTDPDSEPTIGAAIAWGECSQWLSEPDVGRVAHGVPARVDRLRSLGNAVVPQVVELIGRAILEGRRHAA